MPIFEYQCGTCEHLFEELVRSSAARPDVTCPACGSRKINRKQSVFATRNSAAAPMPLPRTGGCGRCGDPNGSCSAD